MSQRYRLVRAVIAAAAAAAAGVLTRSMVKAVSTPEDDLAAQRRSGQLGQ